MRVCHVVASINEATGGPAKSVTSLAAGLSALGVGSSLLTLDYQGVGRQVMPDGVALHSYTAHFATRRFRGWHTQAARALRDMASSELDLIHNHGLWMFPNRYARRAADQANIPLIISPRGMLDAWSLNRGRTKKRLAWLLYEQQNLRSAKLFHATSEAELNAIRGLGFDQPVALIPNGIGIPEAKPTADLLAQRHPELSGKKRLLFLSRIHPKKGLAELLQVWHSLSDSFREWHLVIAGPDLIGHQAELERMVAELNLNGSVTFTGMLTGEIKAAALGYADLFVLPTHSENFGIAVAEALAYGLPVVTTKGAPWRDLTDHACGWWVDNERRALHEALTDGMKIPSAERREMGARGRELMRTKYSWSGIAAQMAEVYRWTLSEGARPSCVY